MTASLEIVLRRDRVGLLARTADAANFVDDHELDAPWAYAELALTDPRLPQKVGPFTGHGDLVRVADIDDWIDLHHDGSVLEALRESPLFVSIHPETGLIDGWHRLFVAQRIQLEVIPVILFDIQWKYGNGLGEYPKQHTHTAGGG